MSKKIRCNNCMKVFRDDSELVMLYENIDNSVTDTPTGEDYDVIKACPTCRTDGYLMDLKDAKYK